MKKCLPWIAVLAWMLLIFNLSAQPAEQSDQLSKGLTEKVVESIKKTSPDSKLDFGTMHHQIRKNAHFFAYLALGILVMYAVSRNSGTGGKAIWISLLICILYAISDEMHQIFVPGRSGQASDVVIDSSGALVGIMVHLALCRLFGKN
ncbi:VanZ family protein [Bacillus tianshenii]|uniref:VanZ family protein n=1 Tax=Sutcliffiella tianshenii TaxID=1463404 RepID=UPI001CD308AC|nr:VanZ family protein [Bacillus tianshenii]MCA1320418.1 VanZ family protein [Bacillus tianshenii]